MVYNKSRAKGHNYERQLVKEYVELGWFDALTSRRESVRMDSLGVDICYTDPFYIQAKNYKTFSGAKIIDTIDNMLRKDDKYNLLHLKITGKGEVVCMTKKDWYKLVKEFNLNK